MVSKLTQYARRTKPFAPKESPGTKRSSYFFACSQNALAAIGRVTVPVGKSLTVGVISTGDELIPPEEVPGPGQIRDVNGPMLEALLLDSGVQVKNIGIVVDDEELLTEKVRLAIETCDMVLLSGGSSVGVKDAACRICHILSTDKREPPPLCRLRRRVARWFSYAPCACDGNTFHQSAVYYYGGIG